MNIVLRLSFFLFGMSLCLIAGILSAPFKAPSLVSVLLFIVGLSIALLAKFRN